MGEWADSILDGVFCEGCGEYMGEGDGYPVRCFACQAGDGEPKPPPKQKKKTGATVKKIALIVFVFWNVTFSSDSGKTWTTTRRQRGFDDYMAAQKFIDNAPKGVYECVDSLSGKSGACKVSAFQIGGAL